MDRLTENFGFGIIPKQVMKDSTLSLASKGLYSYLCAYAGNKDTAFPSISLITYELKISKDTFYKYMNELKDRKYIETTQEKAENGQFKHSVYNLLPCPKIPDTVKPDTETPDTVNKDTKINSSNKNNLNKNNLNKDIPYSEIIDYLNLKADTKYRSSGKVTKDLIKARFNETFTLEDFKTVIDNKVTEWNMPPLPGKEDMRIYLRPQTLFSNKFESYLNQKVKRVTKVVPFNNSKNKFVENCKSRDYDFDDLESKLLGEKTEVVEMKSGICMSDYE